MNIKSFISLAILSFSGSSEKGDFSKRQLRIVRLKTAAKQSLPVGPGRDLFFTKIDEQAKKLFHANKKRGPEAKKELYEVDRDIKDLELELSFFVSRAFMEKNQANLEYNLLPFSFVEPKRKSSLVKGAENNSSAKILRDMVGAGVSAVAGKMVDDGYIAAKKTLTSVSPWADDFELDKAWKHISTEKLPSGNDFRKEAVHWIECYEDILKIINEFHLDKVGSAVGVAKAKRLVNKEVEDLKEKLELLNRREELKKNIVKTQGKIEALEDEITEVESEILDEENFLDGCIDQVRKLKAIQEQVIKESQEINELEIKKARLEAKKNMLTKTPEK